MCRQAGALLISEATVAAASRRVGQAPWGQLHIQNNYPVAFSVVCPVPIDTAEHFAGGMGKEERGQRRAPAAPWGALR